MADPAALAKPFAGLKVRGAARGEATAVERVFSESEWSIVQTVSEGLEWSYGCEPAASHRYVPPTEFEAHCHQQRADQAAINA